MKYLELAELYNNLESTTKRLEKTYILSRFLKKAKSDSIPTIMLLIEGRVYLKHDDREVGVAAKTAVKAISKSTGISTSDVEKEWKNTGDLGIVAENHTKKKTQSTLFSHDLTVDKVFKNLQKLADTEGKGAVDRKLQLIAELLTSAKPLEAKYIIRTVLQDLRIGVGEGSIRDAICWAFFEDKFKLNYDQKQNKLDMSDDERVIYNEYVDAIQRAYDMTNDFAEVADAAKEQKIDALTKLKLKAGKPIKVMLFQKSEGIEDAFERVGKPAALEFKYDGFRLQLHNDGNNIKLFTRRLENVTKQFPDIVKTLKEHIKAKKYILDAEIIGIDPKTGKWLPFQDISQRIKRKYDIEKLAKDVPVMINIFDIMMLEEESKLDTPFAERRDLLRKNIKEIKDKLNLAKEVVTDDIKLANEFYAEALQKGNEGIMMKNLDSPYKPGSRVGYGVKVKPTMETLDVVIVGAEWGEGKRASWLSSFSIACVDKEGNFLEIGKVGTGIKEKSEEGVTFDQLTKLLKPLITKEKGRSVEVRPQVVIEVDYEEIQKSPTYSSGYALRFPRLVKLRDDKAPDEASDIKMVEELNKSQRQRGN